jgi:hypothetical protein
MRKFLLGAVATAAIIAPLSLAATSAEAANTQSTAPNCTPVAAIPASSHIEYKYVGDGHTQWSKVSNPTLVVGGVTYAAEYYTNGALKGQHKTQTVIDPAVDGVDCVDAGANIVTGPATCATPGTVLGISGANATIDGGDAGLAALSRTPGDHTANFTALPGHLFSNLTNKFVDDYTIDDKVALSFVQPTVSDAGVVDFGASTCGTWKVGSKVTLDSGTEFQTHGGSALSGPVTRYRLVFTPDANHSLPTTLPGEGGTKVSGSAVYLVYKAVPALNTGKFSYDDGYFGPVSCDESQFAGFDLVSCTSTVGALWRSANETGTLAGQWNSDFNGSAGTLTYTVNSTGTGYTGKVTY